MALPPSTPVVFRRMDPRDKIDLYPVLLQGVALPNVLEPGEQITWFSIALTPETIAAGAFISDGEDAPRYANLVFYVQVQVDPAMRGNPIFDAPGLLGGGEISFATNMEGREKQYSFAFRMVNK